MRNITSNAGLHCEPLPLFGGVIFGHRQLLSSVGWADKPTVY